MNTAVGSDQHREGIFLAYNLRTYGNLPDAWLSPRLRRFSLHDPAYWAEFAQLAETALLDAVFTGDGSQITDPTTSVADGLDRFTAWTAVVEATEHIGFILTASTTYNDPVRLAERLLSLDMLSGGRLAWNVVTSHSPTAAGNFGLPAHPEREARYARGGEFVALVTDLWASATDGPPVDHRSEQFVARGRLAVPPSRQGRPPIIRASTSDAGRDLAGRYANGVFAADLTLAGAVANRANVKADARRFGRPEAHLSYLSGLRLVLGSTQAEADAKVADIYEQSGNQTAEQVRWLSGLIGHDVSTLDPQEPLPVELLADARLAELPAPPSVSVGFRSSVLGFVKEHADLPLAQLLTRSRFVGSGHATFVGPPDALADRLEHWYKSGAADGFVFAPDLTLDTLEVLGSELVPALQRKGLFKHEYGSDTFAGHLNLPPFPGGGSLRFDTDPVRRAHARSTVRARRADPRAENPFLDSPEGVAPPLRSEGLRQAASTRPLRFVALSDSALLQAIAEPDRLPVTPDAYLLGLDRARPGAESGGPQTLDPATAAAVLGLRIPGTAFLPVAPAVREHPWNLARTVGSLGHWLRGRTGVVLTAADHRSATGRDGAEAWDSGPFAPPVPAGPATAFEMAGLLRDLWASYPHEALVVDRQQRRFATGDGIGPIDHRGRYTVEGPLSVASPFSGPPVVGYLVGSAEELAEIPDSVDLVIIDGDVGDALPLREPVLFLTLEGRGPAGAAGNVEAVGSLDDLA